MDDDIRKFRIPGVEDNEERPDIPPIVEPDFLKVNKSQTFLLSAARAGETDTPVIESNVNDVVEVVLEDGTRFWTTSGRLCDDVLHLEKKRGAGAVVELPANLSLKEASRGHIGSLLIKALRFFNIDVPKLVAQKIAQKWEECTVGANNYGPGLYRCDISSDFRLMPWDATSAPMPSDRPVLLFLHGTASSTLGSFGELWENGRCAIREPLFAPYGEHVFALEHRSLSQSPVDNAIEVVEKLPKGTRLHLISHSRGGLVGELLCRSLIAGGGDPFDKTDIDYLHRNDPEKARGDLEKLNRLLKKKQLSLERFVRVACPARGTTLASEHLDIYLSVIFNLIQKVPLFKAGPGGIIYDIFTELIMAIAKERAKPDVLPGIEAMIPSSPLISILNRPDRKVEGELRVIAGDIEGKSIGSALATLLTDPLYLDDHDLVVNTAAMFNGAKRAGGEAYSFHNGAHVSHFRYFENEDSTRSLLKAITRKEGQEDGFREYEADDGEPPYRREKGRPRPVVFLLPGIMGSHLTVGEDRIWIDLGDLAFGGLARLAIDAPGVQPESPVWMSYKNLTQYLASTFDVIPFPFDWRLSVKDEAKRLAEAINSKLDEVEPSNLPVSILGHSMGGLLARAMTAVKKDVWKRMCKHPDARLIMLGTPNGGSYVIPQVITGREGLIKKLSLLDLKHSKKELLQIICHYPGLLELLPNHGTHNLFLPEIWKRAEEADAKRDDWRGPTSRRLEEAHRVRELIDKEGTNDTTRILYVAGCAPATPSDMTIAEDEKGKGQIIFHATPYGDGRVTWKTGRLPGVKTWYMRAVHGDLADHDEGFEAISDLLTRGTTERLPTVAPETRGVPERFAMPEEEAPLYPDYKDLVRTAAGSSRTAGISKAAHKAQVSIVHGSLAYASHPVIAGHYQGDTIVSAEGYLDRVLDGRLRDRHRMGIYPGAEDTVEVFLNPNKKPAGAIVIGLGAVGTLSVGGLIRAVSRGARTYAIAWGEQSGQTEQKEGGRRSACISTLLIGTGAGGISVDDSVTAILRGIANANQWLEESRYAERVTIDSVEFIELYEDRAIQVAHSLASVRGDIELSRRFEIERKPRVKCLNGARRRAKFNEDDSWWRRLQIVSENEQLSFNLLTDRARAEVYLQAAQRSLVDQFIDESILNCNNSPEVAVTLFEMLVPNELKEYAPDRQDLVLVLNDGAARYPWELMKERKNDYNQNKETKPMSIQAGMIRQLQTMEFRNDLVMSRGKGALVVGDPPSNFMPLPGAETEASETAKLLKERGFEVKSLIKNNSKEILNALYASDYRIVHLAGHGVYEFEVGEKGTCRCCGLEIEGRKVTGMVIGENKFLTPAEIRQMRAVPELVFINCCHLGKIVDKENEPPPNNPPRLAANVATQLIRMGVRAVVSAGWAVDDKAAQTFATTFYNEMLSGSAFGLAVLRARRTTYNAYPGVNTWGAYQCYGDPSFTLSRNDADRSMEESETYFAAKAEVIVELNNIAEDTKTASETKVVNLKMRVKEIDQKIPDEWQRDSMVQAALGAAYGELGDFVSAIDHYQASLEEEDALFPLKAVEQLCNLQSRRAAIIFEENKKEARKLINKAEVRLENLIETVGSTVERLSMMGSIAKRKSQMSKNSEKREALEKMGLYYKSAYEKGSEKKKKVDSYPLINWLTADVLFKLTGDSPGKPPGLKARLQQVVEAAAERNLEKRNFWDEIAPIDATILEHLAGRDLAKHTREIIDGYQEAKKQYGSPRELRSVVEHIKFLADMIHVAQNEKVKAELTAALEEILTGLKD